MPKSAPIQTSFNGGIQTPLLDGHINAPRRDSSVKDMQNLLPLKQGPAVRRGGTKHVMALRPTVSTRAHLIPFFYNDTDSYVLEISGDTNYGTIMRPYKNNELVLNSSQQRDVTDISLSGGIAEVTVSSDLPSSSYITGAIVFFDDLDVATELNNGYYKVKAQTGNRTFTLTDYNGNDITSLSTEGGGTGKVKRPLNVILPYCHDDLFDSDGVFQIQYVQSNDVIYMAHPNYPLQVLARTSNENWTCNSIDFDNGPWFENETDIEVDVATTGTSRRFLVEMYEADNSSTREYVFSRNDVSFNEHITTIQSITAADPAVFTVNHTTTAGANGILIPFADGDKVTLSGISMSTASGDWTGLNGRTYIVDDVSAVSSTQTSFKLLDCVTGDALDTSSFSGVLSLPGSSSVTIQRTDRLMRIYFENSGGKARYRWGRLTALPNTATASNDLYDRVWWTIDSDKKKPMAGWLYIRDDALGPGGARGTDHERTDASDWALGAYSKSTGYPSTVSIHEGRVWIGGNSNEPRRLDGSVVGRFSPDRISFQDITPQALVKDNLGISVSIGGGEGSPITWIDSTRNGLMVGTTNRVGMLSSNENATAMTPENVSYKVLSTTGNAKIRPLQVDNVILFVSRSRRRLHELGYNIQADGYVAPDLTELAEHLTRTGITDMAYQQEPINTLWVTLTDGSLIALTYEKNADVIGWHRHIVGGADVSVKSVAVAPSADRGRDEVWIAVDRTIGGITQSHVEYMGRWYEDDIDSQDAYHVDAGRAYESAVVSDMSAVTNASPAVVTETGHSRSVGDIILFEGVAGMTELNDKYFKITATDTNTFDLGWLDGTDADSTNWGTYTASTTDGYRVATNTFSNLNHLEGQTVQVYVDGRWLNDATVSSGSITLGTNQYGAVAQIGLPFEWQLETHRIEAGSADGTAQAKLKRMEEVAFRLSNTLGFQYGDSVSDLYEDPATYGVNSSTRTPFFTGDLVVPWPGGYEREGYIVLKGSGPFPAQIQAVMPKVTTND